MLAAASGGDPALKEIEESLGANVRRLELLIGNLVDSFRPDGTNLIQQCPVEMAELAQRVVQSFLPEARRGEIQLELDIEGEDLWVSGSEPMLERMAANLVSNALKYTHSGGRVTVRVQGMGDCVLFEVEDTGIGIAEADQERILEWGVRTAEGIQVSRSGLGLGLAICRMVVEAHAARLSIDSEAGKGSRFRVEFPD